MDTSKTLVRGEIRLSDERTARRGELALGRYRLLDRLGSGGFGTVWRARDEQLARTVALKRIPLPSPQERDRALREAHATARLSHPAIVALYEACADEDAFYLISELVDGQTLAELIAADELSVEETVAIGLALADGLRHAHSRGVVHRDVKPQNVLVPHPETERSDGASARAAAKLADFGGALLAGDEALTRTGDVYGTLAYMAPEQCDGHEVGPAADLYSLALVLYEAFCGVNPVRGRTPAATAKRIGAQIDSLRQRRRDLPRVLTAAVDLALAPDPRDRGTLDDLQEALVSTPRADSRRRRPLERRPVGVTQEPFSCDLGSPPRRLDAAERPDGERRRNPTASSPERDDDQPQIASASEPRRALALPRTVWIGLALAVAAWQAIEGMPGVALLLLAATAPLSLLPRRTGPGWLAAAAAPALGAIGLAGVFPALAGQRRTALARAALAALGFWWLALAEPVLAERLWLGPPPGTGQRSAWEGTLGKAAKDVLGGVLTPELAVGGVVWALAAAVLPWIVRGRNAAVDMVAAIAWTAFLLAAAPLAERALLGHATADSPRGAVFGAALACALAICARALRGPI